MPFGASKPLGSILNVVLITSTFAHTLCSVDDVLVRGRVDHAPSSAEVHVQLVYARDMSGESGDAPVENGTFSISIDFLTQSRKPFVVNGILEKCNRRPRTVIVRLVERDQDHEYDRVTLDFAKDFRMTARST